MPRSWSRFQGDIAVARHLICDMTHSLSGRFWRQATANAADTFALHRPNRWRGEGTQDGYPQGPCSGWNPPEELRASAQTGSAGHMQCSMTQQVKTAISAGCFKGFLILLLPSTTQQTGRYSLCLSGRNQLRHFAELRGL